MNQQNIIPVGIAGPMGGGKSTVCQKLMHPGCSLLVMSDRLWHWALNTASHAAVLKRMLEAMGVPKMQLYGTQAEKAQSCEVLMGKSARHAMQTLGTEWGRKCIDPKVWLNCFNREVIRIAQLEDHYNTLDYREPFRYLGVLSDDVRFPNEVENIQEQGGIVFWLEGRQLAECDETQASHRSEQDLSKLPGVITIDNSGELVDTEESIYKHIDLHLEKQLKEQNHA